MLFSVIIPMYNVEDYLGKCIDSILDQSMDDFEIILINDCSTDNTYTIAKEYASCFHNIILLENKVNLGLSMTRNNGLKVSKGDYIVFVDSDDYVEPNFLDVMSEVIYKNNRPDIIYTGFIEERGDRKNIKYGYASSKDCLYLGNSFLISELEKRTLYAAACFGIYRRIFLIDNSLYFKPRIFHEDELWTPQVIMLAETVYTSSYYYYHYVRRKNSITKVSDKTQNGIDLIESCWELKKIFEYIPDNHLKKIMDNHIAMLYMKAMCRGRLYRKQYRTLISRTFPLKHTCFLYDKMKAVLFFLSLEVYYLFDKRFGDNED